MVISGYLLFEGWGGKSCSILVIVFLLPHLSSEEQLYLATSRVEPDSENEQNLPKPREEAGAEGPEPNHKSSFMLDTRACRGLLKTTVREDT